MPRRRWIRKFEHDARRGVHLPLPAQIVSNEEFIPLPQTGDQKRVERAILATADAEAKRLGIDRRAFLASSGGMAAAFLALNAVFGCRAFDVSPAELTDPAAYGEKWPKGQFIFDVQTHHVAAGRRPDVPPLLQFRKAAVLFGNQDLAAREPEWDDLYLANYVKEIFLDSDTVMAVITGLPAREEQNELLPPARMIETRAAVNGLARSRRLIAHGLFAPDRGSENLEDMQRQAEQLRVEAWKGYPGLPLAAGGKGWFMDDERTAYPAYEYSRRVGIRTICVHKGLPLPGWNLETTAPLDVPKAARDFPDLNFLIYHSGFRGVGEAMPAVQDHFRTSGYVAWVSDLCEARKETPSMNNVYMELGTTFGMTAITQPLLCAHILGLMLDAFGEDHILWGTDSIWWGSPQWQIEAFRRFSIPDELLERFGYPQLTARAKEKILGLNAARVYGVDLEERRKSIPGDSMSRLRSEYLASGGERSNAFYGWVQG